MKIHVLIAVVICIGLLSACRKEGEPTKESDSDISGYYLKFRRQGKTYVWNEGARHANQYNFDAYYQGRSANLLLNVSPGTPEISNPFSFNITLRTQDINGNHEITSDGKNGNAFSFFHGSTIYSLKDRGGVADVEVSITKSDSDLKIIEGHFRGVVVETLQDRNGQTDSSFVTIEGSFRLRFISLPEAENEQNS